MEGQILYSKVDKDILITTNFEEIKRRMDVGIDPKVDFKEIGLPEIKKLDVIGVAFDKMSLVSFEQIRFELFSNLNLAYLAFHQTESDLSNLTINVNHLVIGEKSIVNFAANNFNLLKEITFLSVKTFKGKILGEFPTVEKLILWYGNKETNEILTHFPNLKYLEITNANISNLDLSSNRSIETLHLYLCSKLEQVRIDTKASFKNVFIENCKKLDIRNLGENVRVRN